MIEKKPAEMVNEKTIDKINEVSQIYVTPYLYECINATKRKIMLLLTTRAIQFAVAADSWFRIRFLET